MTTVSSNVLPEEQCAFDLKYDLGSEDCLTELFRSRSLCEQVQNTEDDRKAHNRKRKMDKEGFVTPATPDIPKSSLQYGAQGHSTFAEHDTEAGERGDAQNEDPEGTFVLSHHHQQQQSQPPHDAMDDGTDINMSHRPNVIFDSVVELFENAAMTTKRLIVQMAQNFRESEEYESMCLRNVESLLLEAQKLEASLRQQKELLQERLFSIGRRLSMDP